MRKVLISILLGFNTTEITSPAPITDISEINANADDKKENKYKEAIADTIMPNSVKNLT